MCVQSTGNIHRGLYIKLHAHTLKKSHNLKKTLPSRPCHLCQEGAVFPKVNPCASGFCLFPFAELNGKQGQDSWLMRTKGVTSAHIRVTDHRLPGC